MKRKQEILEKVLVSYNIHGIEYIGVRDIARDMNFDPGNITTHYAKKEDLINAIALQFSEKNKLLWVNEINNRKDFFDLLKSHFQQQVEYRCLFINFANLQTQHSQIAERNKKEEKIRKEIISASILSMCKNGELKKLSPKEIDFLTSNILMIIKFWISEATISHLKEKTETQINYFLKMIGLLVIGH